MRLVVLAKGAKKPIGSVSPKGDKKKVAEGKWVSIPSREKLPKRISSQVTVPPAWSNVQYFTDPDSKLLVKGEDSKGRTQYLYRPEHVDATSKEKFARINALNEKYDDIVIENATNVAEGLPEAECLSLILDTGIRPGSEKETNAEVEAFGATTLQGQHVVQEESGKVRLEFTGKKGVELSIPVESPEVASMLLQRKKSAGERGRLFDITGDKLLRYTKRLGGNAGFQTKDFRTHLGTEIAMRKMSRMKRPETMAEYKKAVRTVADKVAEKLGNTRKVALSSYVNPAIFEKWRSKIEST